jgi:hypothetical protein
VISQDEVAVALSYARKKSCHTRVGKLISRRWDNGGVDVALALAEEYTLSHAPKNEGNTTFRPCG